MNKKPIESSSDPDLRGSFAALLRAAQRAREIGRLTGTGIVICRDGVIRTLTPSETDAEAVVEAGASETASTGADGKD